MHIIRLRGPWELEPVERFVKRGFGGYEQRQAAMPRERCQMPADWSEPLGPDYLGVGRYCRKFNRPTNLSGERVWLVVEPPRSCGHIFVNGSELGYVRFGSPPGRFDITSLLDKYNSIMIEVEHPELDDEGNALQEEIVYIPGGLIGEVRLEIDE